MAQPDPGFRHSLDASTRRACGCLFVAVVLLVIILMGIGVYEGKRDRAAQRPVRMMSAMTDFINSARPRPSQLQDHGARPRPGEPLADVAERYKSWHQGTKPDDEIITQITFHSIPPNERVGSLEKVDFYLQYRETGMLANGETFKLPYDAAALQVRQSKGPAVP